MQCHVDGAQWAWATCGWHEWFNYRFAIPLKVGSDLEDFVHLLHTSDGVQLVYVSQTIRLRRFNTLPSYSIRTDTTRHLLGSQKFLEGKL